ncbi:peptide-methionine (S)-S-oxide reductase MsrA [Paenibacillus qinlingensis]|uniref:peptide-methionine (S)-S-oxide reductase MsrA n=1 Tax=Paenibacillus qinlingensis TaxID=1837343 RepID=UPI001563C533|nr:peptide-methionine (S)-S-oxide reductase MsrA [Paenibacillus qinlingensis]NQX63534.1 peptide-methionine (S)-S-oxide reductase MsrA [Paenibacillus qinlingensis]
MRKFVHISSLLLLLFVTACASPSFTSQTTTKATKASTGPTTTRSENPNDSIDYSNSKLQTIYLAGGCFWGVEAYISRIPGVQDVTVGYANGIGENPTYKDVVREDRKFAETVEVKYDPERIALSDLLKRFFKIINPTSLNKQGNDAGISYRSGVYYVDESDISVINEVISSEQKKYDKKIVTEVLPLTNYYLAEEEHQDYLVKNPNGYCHVDLTILDEPIKVDPTLYTRPSNEELKAKLSDLQYKVIVLGAEEQAFSNEYWNTYDPGIYVDIATGEPLFSSRDKYDSGCGWPSFTRPIDPDVVTYEKDTRYNLIRTALKSRVGAIHLGHVFDDGPAESTGKRYCIDSASIRFVPQDKMQQEGYGYLRAAVE